MADEITIEGLNELEKKLSSFDLMEVLRPPMYRAVLRLQSKMAKYPPARAGSRYKRTGSLGRRWTHDVDINRDSIKGKVGNRTLYGPYVQSEQFQARWHRGIWQTDQRVLNEERHSIINDFQTAINTALED